MSANKVYVSQLPITKPRLAHKKAKLRVYKTLIEPVLSYGCEAWTMTQSSEERLAILERKIRTRIFGPVYEN
jgi:predicted component of type VI protein secretion system